MDTTLSEEAPTKTRRSDRLVGNRLVLLGAVLYLCEFVGIIASHVHTMPTVPGAGTSLGTTYAGQVGATAFLVGWYSLVLPGRVLFFAALRQALVSSDGSERLGRSWRTLLDWAVLLVGIGVVVEMAAGAVLAATAATASHGGSAGTVYALDHLAHYLEVALYCPSGIATALFGVAMWRSGVFPRVLAGLTAFLGAEQALNGSLLTAPSTAGLQEGLTVLNLLAFVAILWIAILTFRRTPRAVPAG
jgi:hypothetical protein